MIKNKQTNKKNHCQSNSYSSRETGVKTVAPRDQLPSPVHIPPDNFNSTPQVYPAVEQNVKQAGEVCSSLPLPRIWHLCWGNLFYERTIDTRIYPTYKIRSGGCALLEQLWRDTPHPSTSFWTLVDYDGYSISSKGFLPTVVDIMVIWVKFTHSSPF